MNSAASSFFSSPQFTFFAGLFLLVLFGWYFGTDIASRKRWLGLALAVFVVAFCLQQAIPPSQKILLGLDLKGGTSFLIKLTGEHITKDMQSQAVEVIRKRVDKFGGAEPFISPQGADHILVQMPGLEGDGVQEMQKRLEQVAKLDFSSVLPGGPARIDRIEKGLEIMPPGYEIKTYKITDKGKTSETKMLVKLEPEVSGDHVTKAFAYLDNQGWGVSLTLDSEGAKLFDDVAAVHVNEPLAIILDGEILSAPNLNTNHYGGKAQITGHYQEQEARDLASALENPLRTPISIEETRNVSATLGTDSIMSGVYAGLSGMALVFVFVMIYYRFAGIIAFVGLLVNLILLFGLLAMFHMVLTLPGIAGIILTMGMAVDANVLIYERLREEMAAGKSIAAALEGAYDKAFSAIFDANATTLITAVILFWQATGTVKGFAVTLTMGILASMFSSLLFTRTSFRWLVEKFDLKKLSLLDLIPKKTFDFLGKRRIAAVVSILLIGGSIAVVAVRGGNSLGIDFRGGDLLVVDSTKPVTVAEARDALKSADLGEIVIQNERQGSKQFLAIRSPKDTATNVMEHLTKSFPDRGLSVSSQEQVGAQIGMEFAKKACWALGLGIVGILIYVTLRFEFSFALGAVVALLHDIIITVGVFCLTGGELSLVMVGAILTIGGYSINDTIVVFDRIREALKRGDSGSIQVIMNRAVNETLGRTILTGGTTLLSVASLFFFGGAVLRDFSFAILIGILVGTYSSVFIAAPIVLWWSRFRGGNIRHEVLGKEPVITTP
ncbi:protein translocase subunit SecDF [soil metagenome]